MWIIVTKKVFLKWILKIESDCDLRLIDIISDGKTLTAFKINGLPDDRTLVKSLLLV
jgi:hypothetical protein